MAMSTTQFLADFNGLDFAEPARWPSGPKWVLAILAAAAICALGWFFYLDDKLTELKVAEEKEVKLRLDYQDRMRKAVNLTALKKQKEEVSIYVAEMERQLPNKAEMDRLLTDINRAGTSKGLVFELFRPGIVRAEAYYAELPIAVKVTGTYHELAGFAADVAALPRIVTLNNMNILAAPINNNTAANNTNKIVPNSKAPLTLDTTIKTFRYLDAEEVAANRKAREGKDGAKK